MIWMPCILDNERFDQDASGACGQSNGARGGKAFWPAGNGLGAGVMGVG